MFNPNRGKMLPSDPERHTPKKKPMEPAAKRRLWVTLGLTFLLLIVWFGGLAVGDHMQEPMVGYIIMIAYFAVFAATLIAYLVYNRAFVNRNVTVEMLPPTWTEERKQTFVEENRRRAERSRWMVTLIIPFAVVFLVESLNLFIWDPYIAPLLGL